MRSQPLGLTLLLTSIHRLEEFDEHRNAVAERQAAYEKQVQAKTKAIRDTEAANMKQGRKKNRGACAAAGLDSPPQSEAQTFRTFDAL